MATNALNLQTNAGLQMRLAYGDAALDGGNPTPITTGLSNVHLFGVQLVGSSAPGVGTTLLTYLIADAGTVNVYAWKVTGTGDTTLIASTGTDAFRWFAVGT